LPPQEESYKFAELIANEKIKSIVINMEHAAFDQGLAQQLANHLKAPCYALSELKAENLYHTVKEEWGSREEVIKGLRMCRAIWVLVLEIAVGIGRINRCRIVLDGFHGFGCACKSQIRHGETPWCERT
jgi:hypothetical protein